MDLLPAVLLGCLVLFPIWTAGYIEALDVIQSPGQVKVPMGHSASICCCWKEASSFQQLRVKWTKNHDRTPISSHIPRLINQTETISNRYKLEFSSNCCNLTISSFTLEDVGLYTCEVTAEIPLLQNFTGQGTQVDVQADDQKKARTSGTGVALPLAGAVIMLCFTAAFCLWRRWALLTSCLGHHGGMVIREERQCSMEEMNEIEEAAEHNSNSSRGSEQWCPVQLYESIDYFTVQDNADT